MSDRCWSCGAVAIIRRRFQYPTCATCGVVQTQLSDELRFDEREWGLSINKETKGEDEPVPYFNPYEGKGKGRPGVKRPFRPRRTGGKEGGREGREGREREGREWREEGREGWMEGRRVRKGGRGGKARERRGGRKGEKSEWMEGGSGPGRIVLPMLKLQSALVMPKWMGNTSLPVW